MKNLKIGKLIEKIMIDRRPTAALYFVNLWLIGGLQPPFINWSAAYSRPLFCKFVIDRRPTAALYFVNLWLIGGLQPPSILKD